MSEDETAKSLFFEGLGFLDARDYINAELRFRDALKLRPQSISTLANLSVALLQQDRTSEAQEFAARVLLLDGNNIEAHLVTLNCLAKEKRFAEVLRVCEKVIAIEPRLAEVHSNRGFALNELGRPREALASYDQAIALQPDFAQAHLNRGTALNHLKRHDDALASYKEALGILPNLAEAHVGSANACFSLKHYDEAIAAYGKALTLKPGLADAWVGRGNVMSIRRRYHEAFAAYDRALALDPALADAWLGRGNAFAVLKRYDDALAAYDRGLALKPDFPEAWVGRGHVLFALKHIDEALAAYDRALAAKPELAAAWLGRGSVLLEVRRYDEAIAAFDRALACEPDLDYAEGFRLHARMHICDWSNFEAECSHLMAALRKEARLSPPLVVLGLSSSAADQLWSARLFSADKCPPASPPLWQGERYRHDRIRVAYISGDLREHPVSYLTAGLFEQHDRARFETIAVSFGADDQSEMRARLKRSFERFVDARGNDDAAAARLLRELEVDVAVDLMGHTADSRAGILAARAVPIQVNYLGYPGTSGTEFIDYILADRFVIPEERRQHYSEQVVYLPDTFQATDAGRHAVRRPPSRAEAGLPADGFVFCSFNNSYKLTPTVFECWMRLLRQVEGSVLWLLAPNAPSERNLRREAAARGIEPRRLVLAQRVGYAEYLARYQLADLFLDTLPFNAGTTASDALWAGLPLLTCSGDAFAARMAGSLLHAVGLSELVTQSLDAYEALALKLARDPALLASFKTRLARNRDSHPLFDTLRFTRHVEAAYATMWERHQRGEPPASFSVAPIA